MADDSVGKVPKLAPLEDVEGASGKTMDDLINFWGKISEHPRRKELQCPRAPAPGTPCAALDGAASMDMHGNCMGCGQNVAELYHNLVIKYVQEVRLRRKLEAQLTQAKNLSAHYEGRVHQIEAVIRGGEY